MYELESEKGHWQFWLIVLVIYAISAFFIRFVLKKIRPKPWYVHLWCFVITLLVVFLCNCYSSGGMPDRKFWKYFVDSFFKMDHSSTMMELSYFVLAILMFPIVISTVFMFQLPKTKMKRRYFLAGVVVFETTLVFLLYHAYQSPCKIYVKDEFCKPVENVHLTYHGFAGEHTETTGPDGTITANFSRLQPEWRIAEAKKKGFSIDLSPWGSLADKQRIFWHENEWTMILPAWSDDSKEFLFRIYRSLPITKEIESFSIDIFENRRKLDAEIVDDIDIEIQLPNSRAEIFSGEFDWSIEIRVNNGGLQEVPLGYTELAPETGYAEKYKIQFEKDQPDWRDTFSKNYIFKLRDGKIYSVAYISVTPMEILEEYGLPHLRVDAKVNTKDNRICWEQFE